MSFEPRVFQQYKGLLPIENELVDAIRDCRKAAINGAQSGNFAPYFEAVQMLYSILPPEIKTDIRKTTEYRLMIQGIPPDTRQQLAKLSPLDKSNAQRHLLPKFNKQNADRFFRCIVDQMFEVLDMLKGKTQVEGFISDDDNSTK
jgi:hypothetical protein|tara:strand:- start:1981 stop:2415 length:435 start_codon:yes stop_codon:yes gene_type:complete